jgi:hypothetical protein
MLPIVAGIVANLINNGMHKVADQVIEKGVDAVQQKLGIELKPEGEATPEYNAKLQEEANRHSEFMAELDEKSTQRATDMQMEALRSADQFVRRFLYYYAWFWGVFAATYFFAVSFLEVQNRNRDFVNIILGFLIGTTIPAIIAFFYGQANKSREDTMKQMKELQGGGK